MQSWITAFSLSAQASELEPAYHGCLVLRYMDNLGLDAVNLNADDVLSNRRQAEISELLDKLARFKPTKIAIEAQYKSPHLPNLYEKYLAGEYKLGRNEIEQFGFQLKRLNLEAIYLVDFSDVHERVVGHLQI